MLQTNKQVGTKQVGNLLFYCDNIKINHNIIQHIKKEMKFIYCLLGHK